TSAAARGAEVYAAPRTVPELSAATLDARFRATRREIARALATARRFHDEDRARVLSSFLGGNRRFLAFDPRGGGRAVEVIGDLRSADRIAVVVPGAEDRKSTRLNSSHVKISYAVFCLKKKNNT